VANQESAHTAIMPATLEHHTEEAGIKETFRVALAISRRSSLGTSATRSLNAAS